MHNVVDYFEDAISIYQRVERSTGQKPTQESITRYLGSGYKGTAQQKAFIALSASMVYVRGSRKLVKDEETGEGKVVVRAGHYKLSRPPFARVWSAGEEAYVKSHSVDESMALLKGRYTRQAIMRKRQRLLKKERR